MFILKKNPTHFLLLIANNTIEIIPISATGSCIQVMVSTYYWMNFETKQNFESLLTVCFPPRKKMHAALKLISAKGKHKQGLLLLLFIKR